ncbi:hypothetical protein [Flavobacterium sp. T12S277]|uniref:hypothetical protein n=1 Tax=Flavobacterium sp. T12S277 TaxID=3402752 RepID=UPI003AE18C9E
MSKIKLIIVIFIFSIKIMFSQGHNEYNRNSIYLDLKDKALESYEIDKDTMNAHFSVYFKKYQSKKERDKATEIYKDMVKNIRTSKINPSEVRLPTFSISFLVYNEKPEKLKSLKGIKFITLKQFRDNDYRTSNPTYIIHKLKDGTYLRWLAITMDEI